MVHCFSFRDYLLYAFKYTNANTIVGEYKPEKFGFDCPELGFLANHFFYLRLLIGFRFLVHISVMLGFEVCRAYIFCIMQVFSEKAEKVYVVAPKRCIFDFIAVSDADADGLPILVDILPTAVHDAFQ